MSTPDGPPGRPGLPPRRPRRPLLRRHRPPPTDRVWRHPSELGSDAIPDDLSSLDSRTSPRRLRRDHLPAALVASAGTAAVLIGVLLLVGTGSVFSLHSDSPPTTDLSAGALGSPTRAVLTSSPCCAGLPPTARALIPSMVTFRVATDSGTHVGCGIAIGSGGLVATVFDDLAGARAIEVFGPDGTYLPASVVGLDRDSDVSLLQVGTSLPPVPPTDDSALIPGSSDLVLGLEDAATNGLPTALWSTATISDVGQSIPQGTAAGMAGITTLDPSMPDLGGALLLDSRGDLLGFLDPTGTPAGDPGQIAFLPASFVVNVALTLAQTDPPAHATLDLAPTTGLAAPTSPTGVTTGTPTTSGARVAGLAPASPAVGLLEPDDLIVALDDRPVRSIAELRSLLYLLQPGVVVDLTLIRHEARLNVDVTLAAAT